MVVDGLTKQCISAVLLKGNLTDLSGHGIVEGRMVIAFYFDKEFFFPRKIRIGHLVAVREEEPLVVSVVPELGEHISDPKAGIIMDIDAAVRRQSRQQGIFCKHNLLTGVRESGSFFRGQGIHMAGDGSGENDMTALGLESFQAIQCGFP